MEWVPRGCPQACPQAWPLMDHTRCLQDLGELQFRDGELLGWGITVQVNTLLTLASHIHSPYTHSTYTHYIFKKFFPELFLESHQLELCKAPRNRQCCPSSSFWPSRMTVLMRLMPFRSTMSTKGSSNKANHGVL